MSWRKRWYCVFFSKASGKSFKRPDRCKWITICTLCVRHWLFNISHLFWIQSLWLHQGDLRLRADEHLQTCWRFWPFNPASLLHTPWMEVTLHLKNLDSTSTDELTVAENLLKLCFYARRFLQCTHVCVLAHEINHYTLTEHIFTVTGGRRAMCTLTRSEGGQEILKSCLFCHSVVMQDVWLAALLKPRRRTQRCLSVMQILSWKGQNWGWSSSHRYKHCGRDKCWHTQFSQIHSLTKPQMIWLAFSEAYRLSIRLSSITWTKTYIVSPRWKLFWWPHDISSRVTIYSEFHLDQHNIKMSCLWRASRRMILITFFGTCCPFFFHHHQSWR